MHRPAPYPHQRAGSSFLAAMPRAILADDPGTGKTKIVIDAMDRLGLMRVAIVCPAIVRATWEQQLREWQTVERPIHLVTTRQVPPITDGVWVVSYNLIRQFKQQVRKSGGVQLVVFDEFHYLKNPKAFVTKDAFGGMKDGEGGALIKDAEKVWLLSGTPAPNHPAELWPTLRACFPEVLPLEKRHGKPVTYSSFIKRYCKTKMYGVGRISIIGGKNLGELRDLMKPIMLRRRLTDVRKDMPPLRTDTVVLQAGKVPGLDAAEPLLTKVLDAIQRDDKRLLKELNSETSTIRRVIGTYKAVAVADMLKDELASGLSKVVVACWHRDVIDILTEEIGKTKVAVIRGGTGEKGRQDALHFFKHDAKVKVLLLQIKAGGTGLDGLQHVAREGVFCEYSWTADDNLQVMRRLYRTGQAWPVRWRYVSLRGSIDEQITAAAARKAGTSAALFDTKNESLDEVTLDDLLA